MNYIRKMIFVIVLSTGMVLIAACGVERETMSEIKMDTSVTTPAIEGENMGMNQMSIRIGSTSFTASFANNKSAEALKKYLTEEGSCTIDMKDYAAMEKVGELGTTLPRSDEHIKTCAGDLILYQGNKFVIYYGTNSWNLTRLGKIENVSKDELKNALGSGDIKVTLSLINKRTWCSRELHQA